LSLCILSFRLVKIMHHKDKVRTIQVKSKNNIKVLLFINDCYLNSLFIIERPTSVYI
jgi:hypothetical protein